MAIFKEEKNTVVGNIDRSRIKAVTVSMEHQRKLVRQNIRDLYSDKPRAAVVEIVSNAIDAHNRAGVGAPVKVTVSGAHQLFGGAPSITVTDQGAGMTEKQVDEVYRQFGASDKTAEENAIGAYGVGAMAPLAICDTFHVVTRAGGRETAWLVGEVDTDDAFGVYPLWERPWDGPSGTEVTIPLERVEEPAKKLRTILYNDLYTANLEVEGLEDHRFDTLVWQKGGFSIWKQADSWPWQSRDRWGYLRDSVSGMRKGDFCVDINGVRYQIDAGTGLQRGFYMAVKVRPGVFKPSMSRESLDMDYRGSAEAVRGLAQEIEKSWKKELGDEPSFTGYVRKLQGGPFREGLPHISAMELGPSNVQRNDFYRSGHYYGTVLNGSGHHRITNYADRGRLYVSHSRDQGAENKDGFEYRRAKTVFEEEGGLLLIRHYDLGPHAGRIEHDIAQGKIKRISDVEEARTVTVSAVRNVREEGVIPCLVHYGDMDRRQHELDLSDKGNREKFYWYVDGDPAIEELEEKHGGNYLKEAVGFLYTVMGVKAVRVSRRNARTLKALGYRHVTDIPKEKVSYAHTLYKVNQVIRTSTAEQMNLVKLASYYNTLMGFEGPDNRFYKHYRTVLNNARMKLMYRVGVDRYVAPVFDRRLAKQLYTCLDMLVFFNRQQTSYGRGRGTFGRDSSGHMLGERYADPCLSKEKYFRIKKQYLLCRKKK